MKKLVHVLLVSVIALGMLTASPIVARADCTENTATDPDLWTCDNSVGGPDTNGMTTNDANDNVVVDSGSTVDNPAVGGAAIIQMTDGTLTNDGSVSANADAGAGILGTGAAEITNNGDVSATGDAGTGILTVDGSVTNNGTITADGSTGTLGDSGAGIVTGDSNNAVTNNGTVSAGGTAGIGIATNAGDDTVTLGAGSTTTGGAAAVSTGDNSDTVVVNSGATVNGTIDAGAGNDTVTINQNATVNGTIDGGAADTDTLEFAFLTMKGLTGLSASGGTLTYNGQSYTWTNFEELVGLLIKAEQKGKHLYFKNDHVHGLGSGRADGINIYAQPGRIAFIPFAAIPLITFGSGGVRFEVPNSGNWFAVVTNLGPYYLNPHRNWYNVNIYNGDGALVSEDQGFPY